MRTALGYACLAAAALTAFIPRNAAAETWRGEIQCGTIPGLITKPLVGNFEMSTNGIHLTYVRPVHNPDSASLSGVVETGAGVLTGADVKLQGGAAARGYSYTSTYQGRIEGGFAALSGEQVWTATGLSQPFHRACSISLRR